jgi:hypothetical protein
MLQDRQGWQLVPAGTVWCCPDCQASSSVDEWSRCTIIDDNEKPEDARLCPECGSIISASGSATIAVAPERKSWADQPEPLRLR